MKKLLIASDCGLPRWDGVARFLYEVVPRIRYNFETIVIVPNFEGKEYSFKDAVTIKVPTFKFSIADYNPAKPPFKALGSIIQGDIIIFTQTVGPIGALSIIKGKKLGKKVAAYVHSLEWELVTKGVKLPKKITPKIYKQLKKFVYKMYSKCDLLIVPTEEVMQKLKKEKIKTRKVLIPVGVDTQKFKPPKNKARAKKYLNLDDSFIIGYLGRIAREKDIPTLLKAFEIVKKEIPCKLLIVGAGVKDYNKDFKADKDIIVTGSVDNAEDYLRAMDVFVLPSLTETSSLSTMEAMATGLPCITTPVGIMKKKIVNWKNGVKFAKQNYKSLAKKIIRLYKNKKLRLKIGRNARRLMKKYSWEITARRIIEELDKL